VLVVFLAFLTEVVLLCRFDLRDQCAYLWGIPKEYSPIALWLSLGAIRNKD
jgi:hypothetical protein